MTKDDLLNMLPTWFKGILEYDEIMKAWSAALEDGEINIAHLTVNLFIQTCDEPTLEYWEGKCNIDPPINATLEDRREAVIDAMSATNAYNTVGLGRLIHDMFGISVHIYPDPGDKIDPWCGYWYNTPPFFSLALLTRFRYGIKRFASVWYKIAPAHIHLELRVEDWIDIDRKLNVGGACFETQYINIE